MSSNGQEMERDLLSDSSPSLASRRGSSEMGSNYSTENGVFMSSFAAIAFLSGAVTLGVSLISLIIALTVMLQSCQKNNAGIIERYSDNYDYCKNWAFHAELNSLGPNDICKDANVEYIEKGQYVRDLNHSILIAEDFLTGPRQPRDDSRDDYVVMMDAEDFVFDATFDSQLTNGHDNIVLESYYLKYSSMVKLYLKLRSHGWPLVLFSRKPEGLRNATVELLTSAGCHKWTSLVMRTQNEMDMNYEESLSREKVRLHGEGRRIVAVISSQMDALRTRRFGERFFKIPNPIFFLPYEVQHRQAQKM